MSYSAVMNYVDGHVSEYVAQLKQFVALPSISAGADEDSTEAIDAAATFLVDNLRRCGLVAKAVEVAAGLNPLVLAHPAELVAQKPTVLIYGHYDVQGVDNPRSAWKHDPFAAIEEDGCLIGRGSSDNKGPCFAHVKAVEAILKSAGELPVNPIFLIEGEEECGSRAIGQFVRSGELERFGSILCTVISDTSMYGPEQPALTLGLRGILMLELTIRGAARDLHSGLYGGIAPNPNVALARALGALYDNQGGIAVPGFYDDVKELTDQEKERYERLPQDEESYCREIGVSGLSGESGYSVLERRWTRPTLDINLLEGGSPRTVLPAFARAAVSARLVPDQAPEKIGAALRQVFSDNVPSNLTLEFGPEHASPAYVLHFDHPLVEPAMNALRAGFDREPVLVREGGSIPIVTEFAVHTKAPVLLLGLGQMTDNWHGPNERFSLQDFHRGIRMGAALLHELAAFTP